MFNDEASGQPEHRDISAGFWLSFKPGVCSGHPRVGTGFEFCPGDLQCWFQLHLNMRLRGSERARALPRGTQHLWLSGSLWDSNSGGGSRVRGRGFGAGWAPVPCAEVGSCSLSVASKSGHTETGGQMRILEDKRPEGTWVINVNGSLVLMAMTSWCTKQTKNTHIKKQTF